MVKGQRRARSLRNFYLGLGALAVAGAAAIAYSATRPKQTTALLDAPVSPSLSQGYLYGSPSAPVQIVEFADFECPACARFATVTGPDVKRRLVDAGLASFRFFDFPLAQHRNSLAASNAAACAADQGKFWEMHDRIFDGQPDWESGVTRNPKSIFLGYARDLGLDAAAWEQCYDSQRHQTRILANRAEGERRGVQQTPTFFVGRRKMAGAASYDALKAAVDSTAAEAGSGPGATPTDSPAKAQRR